jgi:hypothetical protein
MKIIKVTYTVKSSFAAKNQENINAFINEVREINDPDIRYVAYRGEDSKTFTHLASYTNETSQKNLLELEVFKSFQQQRDEHLEVSPKVEVVELVAASYDLFNETSLAR